MWTSVWIPCFLTLSESYSGHFPPPPGTQGYSIPDGGSSPAAPLSLFRALYTDPAGGSYFPHRCRPDGAPSRGMRQTPPASSPSPHPPVPVSPDRCFPRIRMEDLLQKLDKRAYFLLQFQNLRQLVLPVLFLTIRFLDLAFQGIPAFCTFRLTISLFSAIRRRSCAASCCLASSPARSVRRPYWSFNA